MPVERLSLIDRFCSSSVNFLFYQCSFSQKMPRKYIRKRDARPRAEWTQEALARAMEDIHEGKMPTNKIAWHYGIPARTLRKQ